MHAQGQARGPARVKNRWQSGDYIQRLGHYATVLVVAVHCKMAYCPLEAVKLFKIS
jgi:hypothetical protein